MHPMMDDGWMMDDGGWEGAPDVTSPVSDKLRNNTLKDIHAT